MPIETAIDHIAEEFERLEHINPWARAFRWIGGIAILGGVIGCIVWMLTAESSATSRTRASYIPSSVASVDVIEPSFGQKLEGGPIRFEWESVTGRLQYLVRVYEKGAVGPLLERATTATSFQLLPEERARFAKGTSYVWTVIAQDRNGSAIAAGQSSFKVR
ncbi:MAG TPA: hypothetical protein VJ826_13385 [Candidatus Polarisedimenticolaceae bacterium]|nr:hypothetical protein [Candidatus Polarisedimenticolaceae bacterium]